MSNGTCGDAGGETSRWPARASHGGGPAASRDKAGHPPRHMFKISNHTLLAGVYRRQAVREDDFLLDKSKSQSHLSAHVLFCSSDVYLWAVSIAATRPTTHTNLIALTIFRPLLLNQLLGLLPLHSKLSQLAFASPARVHYILGQLVSTILRSRETIGLWIVSPYQSELWLPYFLNVIVL